jgi:ribokinase
MNPEILVIGSSNTDMVIFSDHLPLPGETIIGGRFFMNPGGKGANQAVAAARLGGNVTFVARVGNDIFGQEAVENFLKEGINTSGISVDEHHPSGVALITVDEAGENSIVVASGANMTLGESDINNASDEMALAEIILMQLEVPLETVVYAARMASAMDKKVILNPAPATELPEELYRNLFAITPNETETALLTGIQVEDEQSASQAARIFHERGVSCVIITMGARGSFISTGETTTIVPAPKVVAVDTTAAGDTFNGALAVALAGGKDILQAVRFANAAAALSVTRKGAQASVPTYDEVISFYPQNTDPSVLH